MQVKYNYGRHFLKKINKNIEFLNISLVNSSPVILDINFITVLLHLYKKHKYIVLD